MVRRKAKTLKAASLELGLSYSQAKRVYRRYLNGGDDALVHGNTGKPSNNRTDKASVAKAVELCREKYGDFGPTPARETLPERDGLEISVSTLRRALLAAGLWKRKKKSGEYRSRRTPKARFGELVQFDGSHHDRVRGARGHLLPHHDDRRRRQGAAVPVFRGGNHIRGEVIAANSPWLGGAVPRGGSAQAGLVLKAFRRLDGPTDSCWKRACPR